MLGFILRDRKIISIRKVTKLTDVISIVARKDPNQWRRRVLEQGPRANSHIAATGEHWLMTSQNMRDMTGYRRHEIARNEDNSKRPLSMTRGQHITGDDGEIWSEIILLVY